MAVKTKKTKRTHRRSTGTAVHSRPAAVAVHVAISQLKLEPGDVIAIRCPKEWKIAQIHEFADWVARLWESQRLPGQAVVLPAVGLKILKSAPASAPATAQGED